LLDIIIKNGHILDSSTGLDMIVDIGIKNGEIYQIGQINDNASTILDAKGCFVTPGLIDFHCHVCHNISDFSLPADVMCFPNGVTTVVDGGSSGCSNYEAFYKNVIVNSLVDIKTLLHVSHVGQPTTDYPENVDPKNFNRSKILSLCKKYKDNIIGIKLRQSKNIVHEFGLEPLKAAKGIAEEAGLRISVHISDSPGEVKDTLDLLDKGDVYCHVFHQQGKTILDEKGKVLDEVFEARNRGVLFDMAHGSMQFSGYVAMKAIEQGFLPDIISSDLSLLSFCKAPTYSFVYILAELLNLGIDFRDIIKRCTEIPARIIDQSFDGFMKVGNKADFAILRIIDRDVHYKDRYGNEYNGDKLIKPEVTIKNGIIVFRQFDFL